ncbi:MAG: ABC transporter ATP-binding protein [Chlamydiales bacterium]|nr:ABC transporter ATP-binding protein [Chlamydiales bacterium]
MRLLLKTAFQNRKHYLLMCFTLISMFAMTIGSSMEFMTLGLLTSGSTVFSAQNGDVPSQDKKEAVQENPSKELDKSKEDVFKKIILDLDKKFHVSSNAKLMIVIVVLVAIFKAAAIFGIKYFTQLISIRVSRDLRQRYFEYIQTLPMSFYQKHNLGSLSSRVVGDASVVAGSINSALINYLQTPFLMISNTLLCIYISFELFLVVFVGIPLVVLPIVYLTGRVKRVSRRIQKNQETFTSVLIDFLAGIQTVKIFAMELFSIRKYKEQNDQMAYLEEKNAKYNSIARPILHTLGGLFLALVLFYGLYILQMQVSSLIVFCGLLYQFYEPIKKFGEENSQIQRGVIAAERMYEVLDLKPEIEDKPGAIEFDGNLESIEFDDVWFRYEDEWVLKGVSFFIKKGESFAIVGPTGSGKSTIVQLIPRLYEVEKGVIRLNGKPIDAYTQKSLRENMAFVSQKPFLFIDTVQGNISFGKSFSEEEVRIAAKRAYADEFIENLPNQYQMVLAESGKNLSGGQQQRLAIARALVKKSPILIMDEATSALDAISENRIKIAIKEMKGHVTQILIAHRFSTIEDSDKILYLDKGIKIAEGPKDELLKTCPGFKAMWDMMNSTARKQALEDVVYTQINS